MENEKKGWLGRLIEKIGNWIEGIFNAAEAEWNNLQPEIQNAIVWGSTVLNVINENVKEAPEEIIKLIQLAVPSLDREKLLQGLNQVADGLNVVDAIEAETLEDTIKNLANYLETLQDKKWAGLSALAAKFLAAVLAPRGTKWDVFESFMLFAYQTFVKKRL